MTGARRVPWMVLAILATMAIALRAADAIPGMLASVPRGVHVCASLAEAESRTSIGLSPLLHGLAGYQPVTGGIRATTTPSAAIALRMRQGEMGDPRLTVFRTKGAEIPSRLRPPLPAFHEIEISIVSGRVALLRAASMTDGSVWQDLEWVDGDGRTALRFDGRTVELLALARRIVEGGR